MSNKIIGILSVVALVFSGVSLFKPINVTAPLGANAGPDMFEHINFLSSFTKAGRHATSTNDTSSTLVEATFKNNNRIDFTPLVPSITATLPATSTLKTIIPKAGDTMSFLFCNATSTAATPVTIAAGTGMNLIQSTSTLAIPTGDCASITFSRQPDSDVDVLYDLGY